LVIHTTPDLAGSLLTPGAWLDEWCLENRTAQYVSIIAHWADYNYTSAHYCSDEQSVYCDTFSVYD
jgi:hypothetical protein